MSDCFIHYFFYIHHGNYMIYRLHILDSGMQCQNTQFIDGIFPLPCILPSERYQCIIAECFDIHAGSEAFLQFLILFQKTIYLFPGIFQYNDNALILLLQRFVHRVHSFIIHFRCLTDDKCTVLQSVQGLGCIFFVQRMAGDFGNFSGEIAVGSLNLTDHIFRKR